MSFVVLDIGAGSLAFARALAWKNWRKRLLVFGGEPYWGSVPLINTAITPERAQRKMRDGATGLYRIVSRYTSFEFPDESLDMVTLNAPHPFFPPFGIETELQRCLKRGGLFFFAYPLPLFKPPLGERFTLLSEAAWPDGGGAVCFDTFSDEAPNRFPPSPTMRNALRVQYLRNHHPERYESLFSRSMPVTSYVYASTGVSPGYQLWVKK